MNIKIYLTEDLKGGILVGFNKETNIAEKRTPMNLAWQGDSDEDLGIDFGSPEMLGDEDKMPHDLLGEIFRRFNIDHPADYNNRSLSSGDMVSIAGHNYLCRPVGWKYLGLMTLPDNFILGGQVSYGNNG